MFISKARRMPSGRPGTRLKNYLVIRMFIMSTLLIFIVETLLMLFFARDQEISLAVDIALDGLLLVVILLPFNWFFIMRPLERQVEEHAQTNKKLNKSSEILERFFSIQEILIAYLDNDFNFIRVNDAYAASDNQPADYFIGKNHFVLFPNPENQQVFETVVKTGNSYHVSEKPFQYADHPERGTTYWDWSLLPVKESDGKVTGLMMVLRDVTSRKQAEMALEESERRFRAAFNQTFQHSSLLDITGRILVVNQTLLEFTGAEEKSIIGAPLWQASWWSLPADESSSLQTAVEKAAAGEIIRRECLVKSLTGDLATMDITIKPLLDERGHPVQLIYEARDISQRIRDEEALKRSQAEIRRLYQAEKRAHYLAETLRSAGLDLSSSLDSSRVLEILLDHLYKVVPFTSAHILMLEDEEHLIVRLAHGEEDWLEAEKLLGKRFDVDDIPFYYQVFNGRQVLNVPDTSDQQDLPFFSSCHSISSWLGIPLLAGDHVIGMCTLEHKDANFFKEDLVGWATALTGQASLSIQNAWLFEQVRDNRERLQALSRHLVEVQELERHYIARELHDEAGQSIASLMFGLRLLERENADQETVVARCQELNQIADGILENLHRLAVDLRPAALDHLGLVPALRQHSEMISDKYGLVVQFDTVGNIERLSGETETAIYRIMQEALTNVVRHAQATHVDILLEQRIDSVILVVGDDGVGYDPNAPKAGHLGIIGMRERADMLGGVITFESSPGQGTTVFLEVPCRSGY